ncbi:hypothetical protein BEWA_007360 [Theileria equi strain WA]|uniref:Uncharacterized protein n=1 Tax=Theileria equi strain WA TaxID=1537102 RepID=L0B0E4_THEEQ|nr:hypothetical protein BEWA_007360 [Theileria equi strain WA]AFZ81327.1 hypothetical protein BEWA_007360 [Theileria equi strain WA]|eukprot:XP_004830993.1 hypothetical protein BEWA_007360 [Theileria equi strain WA]
MKIPNASPSGIIVNFETRCSRYFHPRVLEYVLRNEALSLARNNVSTSGLNVKSQCLKDKLMQLSSSILSCASCLQSSTVARIFHAFSKLEFSQKELYEELSEHFDFESANAKTLSIVLKSFANHPESLKHVKDGFLMNICNNIVATISTAVSYDLTIYATSIPKLIYQKECSKIMDELPNKKFYAKRLISSLRAVYENVLERVTEIIDADQNSFKSFELALVLESIYYMGYCNISVKKALIDNFKSIISSSPNAISETSKLLSLIPSPTYVKENISSRQLQYEVTRLDKNLAEWIILYLKPHLSDLTCSELVFIASACNRLRLWSPDDFAIKFAISCHELLDEKLKPHTLSQLLCYFLRRYETSVNREVSYQKNQSDLGSLLSLSRVSQLCANIGEALYKHAQNEFSDEEIKIIDKIVKIASLARAKRSFTSLRLYTN